MTASLSSVCLFDWLLDEQNNSKRAELTEFNDIFKEQRITFW